MSISPTPESILPREKVARVDHLPSLDGLRALSICLVLLGHLQGSRGFPRINLQIGDYSHLGVVVFFVISGFLITRLMLLEDARHGSVSLKRFYERRALRLFPASYAYLSCVGLLCLAGYVHLRPTDMWHAVTYTVNYLPERAKLIGHLWSLSIEEQFYLIWPITFVLLGPRRSGWAAAFAIALGPVARLAGWRFLRGTPYGDLPMFPMVADSIAMGCLLANLKGWLENKTLYLRLFHPACSVGLTISILLTNRYMDYTVVSVFGTTFINVCLAVLIHRSVMRPNDFLGSFLNWKPVAFIGVLSYSLYLWQQLFLNRESTEWINCFPQNLLLALSVALSSYFLLEMPLVNLRRRLRT